MQRMDEEGLASPTRPLWSRVWNTLVISWVVWDMKRKSMAIAAVAILVTTIIVIIICVATRAGSTVPATAGNQNTTTTVAPTDNQTGTVTPKPNQTTTAEMAANLTTPNEAATAGFFMDFSQIFGNIFDFFLFFYF